jgi:hypothetical protein
MTFRDSYPEPAIDGRSGAEALYRRSIPLFTVLIGFLAAMDIASVVFVLLQ